METSCAYCGLLSSSLAKCLSCDKWFCNSGSPSHIIHHLVKARHREIALHPDSALGDTVLECYNCGSRNLFSLGFIPAKSDTVVVILCRQNCHSSKDSQWDQSQWLPLIEDKVLLPWLVKVPSEDEKTSARHVSTAQMAKSSLFLVI
jgi:regulator of nonsense transcripts 1